MEGATMPSARIISGVLAAAVALASAGCQGVIEGDGERPWAAGRGATGAAGSGPAAGGVASGAGDEAIRAADDAMRAANPALFEVARRYFPGDAAASGRARLFRLTRNQLDATTRALLPESVQGPVSATMPRDPLQTNYEYADNLGFNAANFTPYTAWVAAIVARVREHPASVIDCAAEGDAPSCLREQARSFVARAFRGVTSDAQLERFTSFFLASASELGVPVATGDLVDLTLTSPSYVFRDEVQTDAARALLPAQQLQNVSYTLADAPPEAVGLSLATAAAQVGTNEALQRTVEQVLATPAARDKLLRFFTAWLEVKEPDEFTIDAGVFPEFTAEVAAAAVAETRAFLEHRLSAAAPALKDVTQSTQSFVGEALAAIYGIDNPSATMPVELDPEQRLGIFTQPAVIASHSGPTTTRLVKRGVFFTRKVMCLPLGVPPEDVDTTVPATPGATERQRIEGATQSPRCQGCHAFINPFGFMQENYDAIGRWRTTDEGLPIDADISVDFLDEGPFTASSPVEALRGFTDSLRFQQCFARQLFRFYMGRDEEPGDDPVLRQMFFGFAHQDAQDIVLALRTLAGSPAFSQRSEAP
jgi:hypothetical protein